MHAQISSNQIYLLVLGAMLSGCATPSLPPTQNTPTNPIEISARPSTDWKDKKCEAPPKKSEGAKLTELGKAANACVGHEKWSVVNEWAQVISQRFPLSSLGPYYLSLIAEKQGDLERALWMAEQAVRRSGGSALMQYQKGRLLWAKGETREATALFHKAIQMDPALTDAHLILGQIFFRDQEFSRAAGHYQAVLQSRPKDPQALLGLAECQIQAGDARGALELLERGQRNHPSEPGFPVRSAFAYEHLLNDAPKALEMLKGVQAGYSSGRYQKTLDFDLGVKISTLETNLKNGRSIASKGAGEKP